MILNIRQNQEPRIIQLSEVPKNQFFVDMFGRFCQRVDESFRYNVIFDNTGLPLAARNGNLPTDGNMVIKEIVIITKAQF